MNQQSAIGKLIPIDGFSRYLMIVLFSALPWVPTSACGDDNAWRTRGTVQTYLQVYDGSAERQGTYNTGIYVASDYLDTANVTFGYNYTYADYENNAELTEHLFYLSGRRHFFPDALPGKLTARLDLYLGEDTLRYRVGNTPTYRGHHIISGGGVSTVEGNSDITVFYPQIAFTNYAKTFYADIGYAHSEYDNEPAIEADQITPTVGFGWNDSYDWLQLRGYFITVDNAQAAFDDDQFESLEAGYTHWFADTGASQMEFIRISALAGERLLAVDPDAAAVFSTADKQTGSVTASIQWKLSQTTRTLALANYGRYENNAINDEYSSMLFYINLQRQW